MDALRNSYRQKQEELKTLTLLIQEMQQQKQSLRDELTRLQGEISEATQQEIFISNQSTSSTSKQPETAWDSETGFQWSNDIKQILRRDFPSIKVFPPLNDSLQMPSHTIL